ncbi:MAG: DNA alkylation repair protein [Actinomycetia bacterium]|nr:DNA alkylation repair protein [Actinomycetes bacterium]
MNKLHAVLLEQIKREVKKQPVTSQHNASYEGHSEKNYNLTNPQLRKISKAWLKADKGLSFDRFIRLLNSLYTKSSSATEKYLAGFLIEYSPYYRKQIKFELLDKWLNNLVGWGQVDSLCQSRFSADDILLNWKQWEKLLRKLNNSPNINKRRASLVLLTKPVRDSKEKVIANLAISNIEGVKQEKEILITKAISWLMRELIKNHRHLVSGYLNKNTNTLPAIAVRETSRKLKTGKK